MLFDPRGGRVELTMFSHSFCRGDLCGGAFVTILGVVQDQPTARDDLDTLSAGPVAGEPIRSHERAQGRLAVFNGHDSPSSKAIDRGTNDAVFVRHCEHRDPDLADDRALGPDGRIKNRAVYLYEGHQLAIFISSSTSAAAEVWSSSLLSARRRQ